MGKKLGRRVNVKSKDPRAGWIGLIGEQIVKRGEGNSTPVPFSIYYVPFSIYYALILAVFILFWLVVPMPVNAAGSSDKKDGVTAAQPQSPKVPTVQSARNLVVSQKKGLLSLKAVNAELGQVLAALSKESGVPIKLLDQAGATTKITISFENMTIQAAVSKVMSTLSAGGFASIGGDSGTKQTIYVVTKKGTDNFRSKAQQMIDRIKKGEKPTPVEIKAWLLNVAALGFPIDPAGSSLAIVPVLALMDETYGPYQEMVLSLFQDKSVINPLRSAMLELIGRHWDYPDSRNSLVTVFDRSGEDSVLQGQISRTLAAHGEDVGDKVIQRYSSASPEARFYYAQTLAALDRKDAVALLQDDARQVQSMPLRSASIRALIKLDPSSTQTGSLLDEVIHSAKAVPTIEGSATDLNNEVIAMHAVEAMGRSDNPGTNQKLLLIASDESVAVDVRLTALQSLLVKASAMPAAVRMDLNVPVAELEQRVTESTQLSEVNKERMFARIRMLQRMTAAQ